MDTYAKSVRDVDAALSRLNATLASYRLAAKPAEEEQQQEQVQEQQRRLRPDAAPPSASAAASAAAAVAVAAAPTSGERAGQPEAQQYPLRFVKQRQPPKGAWKEVLELRSSTLPLEITKAQFKSTVAELHKLHFEYLGARPYCVVTHIVHGHKFLQLGYPDLASGAAYKALLLADAVQDTADESHVFACEYLRDLIQQQPLVERIALLKTELHADIDARYGQFGEPDQETDVEVDVWLREHYLPLIYRLLVRSLVLCGCYKTALEYSVKGREKYPGDTDLIFISDSIRPLVAKHFGVPDLTGTEYADSSMWPDSGLVRRELYSWNILEPDRFGSLPEVNEMMAEVAPKLEVKAVDLPILTNDDNYAIVTQLGVFAKEDIAPGEVILEETSLLTANNKLQDALCDACSADLPELGSEGASATTACPDCEVVFCSAHCHDLAMEMYHPALCGMDVEAIAKDVSPTEAADALYALLLLRALALAETQKCNSLLLKETKFIWADFHDYPLDKHWTPPSLTNPAESMAGLPRTLPFSFEQNVRLPFHMLEKMDVDIFDNPQYDTWVINTLYAKFRGTASARLSGSGGRAMRGPEVSAVHPMWCLANHSCDPNVSWQWGGSIKFWARDQRIEWPDEDGVPMRSPAGIKKGDEVLNHYTDIHLPVRERREWARGALGGDCMCERCVWEAAHGEGVGKG